MLKDWLTPHYLSLLLSPFDKPYLAKAAIENVVLISV